MCAVHLIDDVLFRLVQLVEILHGQFHAAYLVVFPAIEPYGRVEVDIAHRLVIALQVGFIDAVDGESPGSCPLFVDEVSVNFVPRFQVQLVCHQFRDKQVIAVGLVVKLGDGTFHEVLAQEGGIEVGPHALEHHAQEVGVRLQYALLHGETLGMLYAGDVSQRLDKRVVHGHGVGSLRLHRHKIGHLDMAAETYHLVPDGMLEAQHYANGYQHHGQADGNAGGGYLDGGARHFALVSLVAVNALGEVVG